MKTHRLHPIFQVLPLLLMSAPKAQAQAPQIAAPLPLVSLLPADALSAFTLSGPTSNVASVQIALLSTREGLPPEADFTQALRLRVSRALERPWDAQLQAAPILAIKQGEQVVVSFWARGQKLPGAPNAETSQIEFRMEGSTTAPYLEAGVTEIALTPQWKRVRIVATSRGDSKAGAARLNIRLAFAAQEVEIGGLEAQLLPPKAPTPIKRRPIPVLGRNLPIWAPDKASRPALRREVSLNGTWKFTPKGQAANEIPVPEYWDARPGFDGVDEAVYEREVSVPASWNNSVVKLEFEGVSQQAEVSVDGQVVGAHVGGWIPFAFNVSERVKPGQTFRLSVRVKGGNTPPIADEKGNPLFPVGWKGHNSRWGICFPVWLRAYGQVHIADAFIQPSYRTKTLTVDYTLHNSDSKPRTLALNADARIAVSGASEATLSSAPVILAVGETRVIRISAPWLRPHLWTPNDPALYTLTSRLMNGKTIEDQETRRFGFREVAIENGRYTLNGVPMTLLGTSLNDHIQGFDAGRYKEMMPDSWAKTVDAMLRANIRAVRFHQAPAPNWMLDVCDEKGMLVVAESALYARDYMSNSDKARYLQNSHAWLTQWIDGSRNHASIVLWSAENELGPGWLKWLNKADLKPLGDTIRTRDTTRPVIYESEKDVGDATIGLHYPEGYLNEPKGSIYSWANRVSAAKPTGSGEYITSYGKFEQRNKWWQGTWTRGMRYVGFSDMRPYTLGWVLSEPTSPRAINLKNSFAPVALFDKAYDDLGIDPLMDAAKLPALDEGAQVSRTLVLYNQEFADARITVQVELRAGGKTLGSARQVFNVALGNRIEIPLRFQVPANGGQNLEMVLSTFKGSVRKFEETKVFIIRETGFAAQVSNALTLSE